MPAPPPVSEIKSRIKKKKKGEKKREGGRIPEDPTFTCTKAFPKVGMRD